MKKLALIIAAIALIAAACGSSEEAAATVNGTTISAAAVEDFAGGADADANARAQALGTLIQWTITEQAAAEQFAYMPTEDEIQTEVDNVVESAGVGSLAELAESEGVPVSILRQFILQLMIQDTVTEELEASLPEPSDEEVAAELVENERTWTVVCTTHLLVETEEEAVAAITRLDGGEEFAAVASEVSIDTVSAAQGGDLGCSPAAGYVDAFAEATMTAEIDSVTGPVESDFGFHVLVVSSRETATGDEVKASILSDQVLAAADEWFIAATSAADVQITEGFGTWVTDPSPAVLPPAS